MSVGQEQCSIWEAIDFYFSEIPEGETGLDSRRTADKQLQDMAEAVITGRPGDIKLDSTIQPNDTFNTQRIDTQLNFNRMFPPKTPNNPCSDFCDSKPCGVHQAPEQKPTNGRCLFTRRELRELTPELIKTSPKPPSRRRKTSIWKSNSPIGIQIQKKPHGDVHGSLDNDGRRIHVYATKGSKMTGVPVVRATIIDVPHWREIGSAAISIYSYLIVKQNLPHHRDTLNIALWHAELEWETVTRLHQALGQGLQESRQEPLPSPDWRSMNIQSPPKTNRIFNVHCTWVKNDPSTHTVEIRVKALKGNAPKGSKFFKTNAKGEVVAKDTHARVTGPIVATSPSATKPVKGGPNREGLSEFSDRLDFFLYHLLVDLDYPLKAATIHVAWRALAYNQYPGRSITLFEEPEYPVRVSYYRVATSSRKWMNPDTPEYSGTYHFEICGETAYFTCITYANISPPDVAQPVPQGLGISFSENIRRELEGQSSDAIVDGITVAAHQKLQSCIRFLISTLYLLKADIKAMRIALYNFKRRINLNPRRPSGALRCRSPFIIAGKNNALFLDQNFSFGNIIDDFPITVDKRLYTGIQIGPLSSEDKAIVLREVNDAFRTFDSFMAALTFVTMFLDSWREVGMDDDTPVFEWISDSCNHVEMTKTHVCEVCGDIINCDEVLREIQTGVVCKRCLGEDMTTGSDDIAPFKKEFSGLIQAMRVKHRAQTTIVNGLAAAQRNQVLVEPLTCAIKTVLSGVKQKDGSTLDQLMAPLALPRSPSNRLLRPSVGWRSTIGLVPAGGNQRKAIFHSSNLRITTVGMNLLSYTWGEAITLRTLCCVASYARTVDKTAFSCLPTLSNSSINVVQSIEGRNMIAHLDECLSIATEENKVAWRQRSRLTQSTSVIKQVTRCLESGLRAILKHLPGSTMFASQQSTSNSDLDTRKGTAGTANVLIANANRRHNRLGEDSPEAKILNGIVNQMSEIQYSKQGVRPPRGKDGLYAIFCGADNSQWCLPQAMKVCKERLYRSIFTCNKGQLRDENWSWKTHYLLAAWDCLENGGVDPFTGFPLTWEKRQPNRGSYGHVIHGQPMLCGFTTPDPTDISQFNLAWKNIAMESWFFNAFKSNVSSGHVEEATGRIVSWNDVVCKSQLPHDMQQHVGGSEQRTEPAQTADEMCPETYRPVEMALPANLKEALVVLAEEEPVQPQTAISRDPKDLSAVGSRANAFKKDDQGYEELDVASQLFQAARLGNANGNVPVAHDHHRLLNRQLRELDPDGHTEVQELYLGDDTIGSYIRMLAQQRQSASHIMPSAVSDWVIPGFAQNVIGEQVDRHTSFVLTAFHFGERETGHWVAGVIDVQNETLTVYDSMPDPDDAYLMLISAQVAPHLDRHLDKAFHVVRGISQVQENAYDCGIFALMNLAVRSRTEGRPGEALAIEDPLIMRRRIALELYHGRLGCGLDGGPQLHSPVPPKEVTIDFSSPSILLLSQPAAIDVVTLSSSPTTSARRPTQQHHNARGVANTEAFGIDLTSSSPGTAEMTEARGYVRKKKRVIESSSDGDEDAPPQKKRR